VGRSGRWPGRGRGAATGETGGPSLGYGELLAGVRRLEVLAAEPPLSQPAAWHFAGHPGHAASRLDAVTGDRRFVSDLDLPGMLYGAVLRPLVPGSALRAADPGPARQQPASGPPTWPVSCAPIPPPTSPTSRSKREQPWPNGTADG